MRFVMSDKFNDTITIVFNIPTIIYISVFSVAVKYLANELSDCSLLNFNHWVSYLIVVGIVSIMVFNFEIFKLTHNWLNVPSTYYNSKLIWFLTFATLSHTFSLASSSFVEEEHQTWYYMTHTFLFIICMMLLKKRQSDQWFLNAELLKNENQKKRANVWNIFEQFFVELSWFTIFVILLVGRRLNQTGDKWLNLPDIGDFLVMEHHRFWNSCVVVICEYWNIYRVINRKLKI